MKGKMIVTICVAVAIVGAVIALLVPLERRSITSAAAPRADGGKEALDCHCLDPEEDCGFCVDGDRCDRYPGCPFEDGDGFARFLLDRFAKKLVWVVLVIL